MFFSVGRVYRENLSTTVTDVGGLLSSAVKDGVTGYLRVSFPYYSGVVFLKGGEVGGAIETVAGGAIEPAPPEEVLSRAGVEGGTLDVYEVVPELMDALQWTGRADAIYKGLRTDSSDMGEMVRSLMARGHSGYIEFVLDDNMGRGLIHFLDGQVVACNFSMADGKTFEGTDMLSRLTERAQSLGALFNVYAPGGEEAPSPGVVGKGEIRGEIVRLQVEITRLYQNIGQKRARIAELQRRLRGIGDRALVSKPGIPPRGRIDTEEGLVHELSRLSRRVRGKTERGSESAG